MVESSTDIGSLAFSPWSVPTNMLADCVVQMLAEYNILQEYNLRKEALMEFLASVQNTYNHNPFHGWFHAVSVTQMMHLLLSKSSFTNMLDTKEKYALFIATLCHDLDHPGLSNTFQINSKSPLVSLYGNKSVLENHHYAVCLRILKQQESKILPNFSEEEKQHLYNLIHSFIMGTDLANHFPLLNEFDQITDNYQWSNPAHRTLFLTMLIKTADISNEARPFPVAKMWAGALMEEYFNQSDLEKARKLPVTPFMDRDIVKLPQSQISFIDTFLLPTFKSLHKVAPELQQFIDVITENRKKWAESA